jgi:predicted metal-dependent hydrolase
MSYDIPIRKLQVDLAQGFAPAWHGGDTYRSCLFNTFSMMFPVLEDHIADVVRTFLPAIEASGNASLHNDTRALIGQEATHRFLHQQYNAQLARQGFSNWVERALLWRIGAFRGLAPLSKLAIVAGIEHVMATFGDGLLRTDDWLDGADPELAKVWRWHAAEETEHKAVAFDVYQFAGGGYWRRSFWYLVLSLGLLFDLLVQTTASLATARALWRPSTWFSAARFWLVRPGIVWQVLPLWLSYFAPRFHPWNHDNIQIVQAWRTRATAEVRIVKAAAPGVRASHEA